MEEKKKYSEPQLTRYEDRLDEVTMGFIMGSPDCSVKKCAVKKIKNTG